MTLAGIPLSPSWMAEQSEPERGNDAAASL